MAAPLDISASMSGSSAASSGLSGATDASQNGRNYGGTNYGPGSLVYGPATAEKPVFPWIVAGLALAALAFVLFKKTH